MAWALKAHAVSGNGDGANGPFKAPTGAGTVNTTGADLYVVAVSHYDPSAANSTGATITDVSGNTGYVWVASQTAAGDANNRIDYYYKLNPTTSAVEQWTLTQSGVVPTNAGLCVGAFSGLAVTPTVSHVQSGTTTSTPAAGSIGSANDLVVTAVADYTATVSSIDSSFLITDQSNYTAGNNIGIALAWPGAGVSGAVNPTWTLSATPTASAVMAVSFTGTGGAAAFLARPNIAILQAVNRANTF